MATAQGCFGSRPLTFRQLTKGVGKTRRLPQTFTKTSILPPSRYSHLPGCSTSTTSASPRLRLAVYCLASSGATILRLRLAVYCIELPGYKMPGQRGKAGATPLWATMPARRGRAQPKAKSKGRGGRGRGSAATERSRSPSAGMTPPGLLPPGVPAVASAAPPSSAEQVESSLAQDPETQDSEEDPFFAEVAEPIVEKGRIKGKSKGKGRRYHDQGGETEDAEIRSACTGDLSDHTGGLSDDDASGCGDDICETLPPTLPAGQDRDEGFPEELPCGIENFMVQGDRRVRQLAGQAELNRQAAAQMAELLTARRTAPETKEEQSFPPAQMSPLDAPASPWTGSPSKGLHRDLEEEQQAGSPTDVSDSGAENAVQYVRRPRLGLRQAVHSLHGARPSFPWADVALPVAHA